MIYYSGTGNSKRVSEWILQKAQDRGMKSHITSFHQFNLKDISEVGF